MSLTLREASKDTLQAENKTWHYYSLPLAARTLGDISRLPKSLKVLLENLLRWQDDDSVTAEDIQALAGWLKNALALIQISWPHESMGKRVIRLLVSKKDRRV